MNGLVLTAGGARGAYQAGVLKRLGELRSLRNRPSPFQIVSGASAGAINGSMIAARSRDFSAATQTLAHLWSDLEVSDVFRSDLWSLITGAMAIVRDFAFGGAVGRAGEQSMLNATPLRQFLARHLPVGGVRDSIRSGDLYAFAVTATSYHSGKCFTFIEGRPGHPVWMKSRRVTLPVEITLEHILASAAIPIVFQPVKVHTPAGEFYFGDGGLRMVTPLSPAIRLGANKVFAVGIRCQSSADDLTDTELSRRSDEPRKMAQPPLSQICGVFMNAIFLDHLDTDIDHLKRMNELILAYGKRGTPLASVTAPVVSEPMRLVLPMVVNPSEDLAIIAKSLAHRMPPLVRYLLDGLGTPDAQSADLLSYLLFDSQYTRALIDVGYRDAGARIDEIEEFLVGEQARSVPRATRGVRRKKHLSAV